MTPPNRIRPWIIGFLALLLAAASVGLAVYLIGGLGRDGGVTFIAGSIAVTVRPPQGTPLAPYAQVDPAIVPYLAFGQPAYGPIPLDVIGEGIPPIGAYLPREGFQLPTWTPTPTLTPSVTASPRATPSSTAAAPAVAAVPTGTAQPALLSATVTPTQAPPTPIPPSPTSELIATVLAFDAAAQQQALAAQPRGFCPPSGLPVSGVLTQRFHGYHSGIDLGVPLGTPVFATHSAQVMSAEWSPYGYGNLVILQSGNYITYYAHLTSYNVLKDDRVQKGAIIGWSGSTGNSSGPHVHYETRIDDIPLDPLTFEARGLGTC